MGQLTEALSVYPEKKLTAEDIKKLDAILDEENYQECRGLRDLASRRYDFNGFDHKNCYTLDNYRNGTLHALEMTRRRISIDSMYKLVEYYFILGYSNKRIIFALFEAGYENFSRRMIDNYLYKNRVRLVNERKKLMDEISQMSDTVFQDMKASVMIAEKKTLEKHLKDIEEIQKALDKVSPIDEPTLWKKYNKMLEELHRKVNAMHGIEEQRKATIDLNKSVHMLNHQRKLAAGFSDDLLKKQAEKESDRQLAAERDVSGNTNGEKVIEGEVMILR